MSTVCSWDLFFFSAARVLLFSFLFSLFPPSLSPQRGKKEGKKGREREKKRAAVVVFFSNNTPGFCFNAQNSQQ